MASRIDLVVGGERAAELVNAYRARLAEMDCLPERAALEVACHAYASGCVHLLAAAGQVWVRDGADDGHEAASEPTELLVLSLENSELGHFAFCREPCGIVSRVPLETLGDRYELARWPQPQDADPVR
ncbi:hypothetical protein LG634_21975 [Streptomyces bambusae]|uniref:hypothetical protein n=1 Tax=Streptomyces bambusae TaxID=1550616 RepID=UPI001CFDCE29|nr:hypothetical protein [Streptomyces bambusae]MCB5167484.1 hypothetical protein [Streptomyces bambusae]